MTGVNHMADVDTITRRRDAVLNTYHECQHPPTRAALVALTCTFWGRLGVDARVWDHATFVEWPTTGGELVEFDWPAIANDPTWSTTEQAVVRTAAALADYAASIDTPARVDDLVGLDDHNIRAVINALLEARSGGPSATTGIEIHTRFSGLLPAEVAS